jgi:hypothetical protein
VDAAVGLEDVRAGVRAWCAKAGWGRRVRRRFSSPTSGSQAAALKAAELQARHRGQSASSALRLPLTLALYRRACVMNSCSLLERKKSLSSSVRHSCLGLGVRGWGWGLGLGLGLRLRPPTRGVDAGHLSIARGVWRVGCGRVGAWGARWGAWPPAAAPVRPRSCSRCRAPGEG